MKQLYLESRKSLYPLSDNELITGVSLTGHRNYTLPRNVCGLRIMIRSEFVLLLCFFLFGVVLGFCLFDVFLSRILFYQ